jgi:hypothetical protein
MRQSEKIKRDISGRYTITDLGPLKKYLGVSYEWKVDKVGEYYEIAMKEFTKSMIQDFKTNNGRDAKAYLTPGFPGTSLFELEEGRKIVNLDWYRTAVGKLLWLVKKNAVDCSNIARELSSHMDKPGPDHWKAMERVIGFLNNNINRVLKLRKPTSLTIESFVDSDYATNKDNRRSVTGYLVTVGGALVSWQSKLQKNVALSSTEAEYVAMSNCATEVKFVRMLLREITGEEQETSILHEDNTGAIFMVNNSQVGARTKHIDIRHHHVKDMVEEKELVVKYIKSELNPADIMTKNVREVIHNAHSPNVFEGLLLSPKLSEFPSAQVVLPESPNVQVVLPEPPIAKSLSGVLVQGGCQECPTPELVQVSTRRTEYTSGMKYPPSAYADWCGVPEAVSGYHSYRAGRSCPTTNRNSQGKTSLRGERMDVGMYRNCTRGMRPPSASSIRLRFPVGMETAVSNEQRVDGRSQLKKVKWHSGEEFTKQENHKGNDDNISYNNYEPDDWITVISKRNKKTGHG